MIKARPLTGEFALAWRHDPALDSERFSLPEDYAKAYESCCETLDFGPITKPDDKPTLFVFRAMKGTVMRDLLERAGGANLSPAMCALAFRLTLIRVDNFDGADIPKIERATDPRAPELGPMLSSKYVDYLDALAVAAGHPFGSIVTELGSHVITRSLVPSPR